MTAHSLTNRISEGNLQVFYNTSGEKIEIVSNQRKRMKFLAIIPFLLSPSILHSDNVQNENLLEMVCDDRTDELAVDQTVNQEDLTKVRHIDDRTIIEFRYPGYSPEQGIPPVMTLDEFRLWNPQFCNATDETIIPAMTPIFYRQ